MKNNSTVFVQKNNKNNSFQDDFNKQSQGKLQQGEYGLFSSLVKAHSTIEQNSSKHQQFDLASSLYTNAEKILKRISQEVQTYHNLTPKQAQRSFQSFCQIKQFPVVEENPSEKLKQKLTTKIYCLDKKSDDKIKKDIVGLKNKFNKMEEPIHNQQIWQVHDKYTLIIQNMAKELFEERKKYQQLLNLYRGTDGSTDNNLNLFENFKTKEFSQALYRQNSHNLLTIDEVSEQQQKTSIAKMSDEQTQSIQDLKNKSNIAIGELNFNLKKSKTTENIITKDNSIIQVTNQNNIMNQQYIFNQKFQRENENSMVTKMQNLLKSESKNILIQNKSIHEEEIPKENQNDLEYLPFSMLQKSTCSMKKSFIKEIISISESNDKLAEEMIQMKIKYQATIAERQSKNQEYVNAVDQYYQSHISSIYQNTKETIAKIMNNPKSAEQQLKILENIQVEQLKKQLHVLRTNNKKIIKILGEQLQDRISSVLQQIYETQLNRLTETNKELIQSNLKLKIFANKLNEQNTKLKSNSTTLDDPISSKSLLSFGCQTHEQSEKNSLKQLENKLISRYEKLLQKQLQMTQKQQKLTQRIIELQKKVKQLEEIRQMDIEIFEKQKQRINAFHKKQISKLKEQLINIKSKRIKNNQNIGFNKNKVSLFKPHNNSSIRNEHLDFKESTVKSINLNDNCQEMKSISPFDQFPELLSNLVFKKTMTIETFGHSSNSGD